MTTRTENDLRTALTSLESEAPDAEAVLAAVRARTSDAPAGGHRGRESGAGAPGAGHGGRRSAARRGRWWVPGLVTSGVAATAAVAAAAALVVTASPDPAGPAPGVFRTGATGVVASVGPGRPVLLAAAHAASHATPGTGRYWRTSAEVGTVVKVGGDHPYLIVTKARTQAWSARASGAYTGVTQPLGADLATPADRAAWRRAGSPTAWPGAAATSIADVEGYADGGGTARTAPGVRVRDTEGGGTAGKPFLIGPRALSPRDLRALPADPARLRTLLLADWRRLRGGADQTQASYLLETVPRVLTMPVTPKVRAALYRMLAALPGIHALGTVRDVAGRRGSAIALDATHRQCSDGRPTDAGPVGRVPSCTVQQRLVLDPKTALPLAVELRYLGRDQWHAPGGLFSYQVYRFATWTNATPPK